MPTKRGRGRRDGGRRDGGGGNGRTVLDGVRRVCCQLEHAQESSDRKTVRHSLSNLLAVLPHTPEISADLKLLARLRALSAMLAKDRKLANAFDQLVKALPTACPRGGEAKRARGTLASTRPVGVGGGAGGSGGGAAHRCDFATTARSATTKSGGRSGRHGKINSS